MQNNESNVDKYFFIYLMFIVPIILVAVALLITAISK